MEAGTTLLKPSVGRNQPDTREGFGLPAGQRLFREIVDQVVEQAVPVHYKKRYM